MAEHKVKVHIKSLPYEPRVGIEYRAGSVQILSKKEADLLVAAGIATSVEDPYMAPPEAVIPYLEPETSPVEEAIADEVEDLFSEEKEEEDE